MSAYMWVAASPFALVAIALNRLCAVVRPLKYGACCTKRTTAALIGANWVMAIALVSLPALGLWGQFRYSPVLLLCTFAKNDRAQLAYNTFYNVFSGYLPLAIILLCYGTIFVSFRGCCNRQRECRARRLLAATGCPPPRRRRSRAARRRRQTCTRQEE